MGSSTENAIAEIKRWRFLQRTIDAKQMDLMSMAFYVIANLTNFIMCPKAPREDIDAFWAMHDDEPVENSEKTLKDLRDMLLDEKVELDDAVAIYLASVGNRDH